MFDICTDVHFDSPMLHGQGCITEWRLSVRTVQARNPQMEVESSILWNL